MTTDEKRQINFIFMKHVKSLKCLHLQCVPKNVDLFRKCWCFLSTYYWQNVSEIFTHSLPLDTSKVDIHLSLSFMIYAELLPLILKMTFSPFLEIFNFCSIITWNRKFQNSKCISLNCSNSNFKTICIPNGLNSHLLTTLIGNNALHLKMRHEYWVKWPNLALKSLWNNPFATCLRIDCKDGVKLCSCDLLWSRLKQLDNLNDLKLEFDSIFKLIARGLFERHFHTKVWSYFCPILSAEVHCFQLKSAQDINLVISK